MGMLRGLRTRGAAQRGSVEPVEETRFGSLPLVLAMLCALGTIPLVPSRSAWLPLAGALAALTYASVRRGALPAIHLGTLCTFLLVALSVFGSMKYWPIPPLLAVLAYLVAVARVPALGGRPRWLARGRLDAVTVLLIVASIFVSSLGLLIWFAVAKPDYSHLVGTLFPRLPVTALFVGVIAFSMINAAMEELVYRGVLLSSLDAVLGGGLVPVALQAIVFGIAHVAGFPRGAIGIGLATVYGLMMGAVRRHAGGMFAPWLAHLATDTVIGAILLHALF